MHAVVESSASNITENGTTKSKKKKNKNHKKAQNQQKNLEAAPTQENHNVHTEKTLNNGTKNGTVVRVSNGQMEEKNSDRKTEGECADIKVNGCAENDQHEVENGEATTLPSSKKSRSKNQRKKRQKYAQHALENGTDQVNDEQVSSKKENSKLTNGNNNKIGDKGLINDRDFIVNGTKISCESSADKNHIQESNCETSCPTSPESKPQSKSSTSSSNSSKSSSSSTPATSSSPSLPSPQPSTSKEAYLPSANNEQPSSSSSTGNQGLELKENEKKEESTPDSAAKEPVAGPSEEEGAVGGIDRSNIVIEYKQYESELQMQDIMRLIQSELSEPYSIYTYRYFIYNWPKLCFLAAHGDIYVGAIVCKLDMHMNVRRGYIAMLAVDKNYRKMKIGTTLVEKAIDAMLEDGADEVVLETEMKNTPALRLYENLGFVRDKRLFRYYLNGVDALRLKLWFR